MCGSYQPLDLCPDKRTAWGLGCAPAHSVSGTCRGCARNSGALALHGCNAAYRSVWYLGGMLQPVGQSGLARREREA
jgi:hypothetical protein